MCLAVPGKIIKIDNESAIADFNGIQKEINVSFIDAKVGEYVIVHAGFAIEKTDKKTAEDIYRNLDRNE